MKKSLLSAFMAVCACGCFAQNLIVNGDFTKVTHTALYPECRSNGGKVSLFTEELTWNKCGKLEVDKIITKKDGKEVVNAGVWIGGHAGKNGGFTVKPDTTYRFSIEIKGNAGSARISAMEWTTDAMWTGMVALKSTVGEIKVQKDWTVYKGTFKTDAKAKRAALFLQLWWDTQYGPQRYKVGDYILFDNVKVEEEKNTLDAPAAAPQAEIKVKTVKAAATAMAAQSPAIDGRLDEAVWADAPEYRDFVQLKKKVPSSAETCVKLLADRENLYIGVVCREPLQVRDNIKDNGMSIWNGDVVEIFFGPKNGGRILSQFAIGAGGGRYATRGKGEIRRYDQWEAKTVRTADGWQAEIKIPFQELGWKGPVENGDSIAFNVCRQRKQPGELSTWSPVRESFHETANFGTLILNDYAAGLQKKYGMNLAKADRAEYERQAAEAEARLLKAKYERNARRKFAAAPVPVTADYAIPFIPEEIFSPATEIQLSAAVNELKPLPLAIANLTNKTAEYRVILETCESYNGKYGLKDFPSGQITFRQAVRFKDSDKDTDSLRLDPLPRMNEACTITIPPKEAGLVWFDFNTADVKPGCYEGRIRIIPLSEPAKWESVNGGFHNRKYTGEMLDISVRLNVRNIVLAKQPAVPFGFFQNAENEQMFRLMQESGTSDFGLSPWDFMFGLDKAGSIDPSSYKKKTLAAVENIRKHLEWGKKYGVHPTFFIGFSGYRTFQQLYGTKNNPEKNRKLWPQWVAAVKKLMNDNGVPDSDYAIETWDEPSPKQFGELIASHQAAKKAAPSVRLLITLGAHIMSAADMEKLAPYTDAWILWSSGYFERPEHLAFVRKNLAQGKKISHYTCSTSMRVHLDRNYRKHAWTAAFYGLSANHMYWFSDCMGGYGASDWKIAMEGGLTYRSFDTFIPSIRYMALREGVTDVKYLAKLREAGKGSPEVEKFLKEALQRVFADFAHDPAMADKVREEAARLILKMQDRK